MRLEFGVLGPLEVRAEADVLAVPGERQRLILAGKTRLALHAAHRLVERRFFPDGQLFVELRGFAPDAAAIDAAAALESLLRSLGVRADAIPDGLVARAAIFRDRLADKRMLIVLDNAADEEQVEVVGADRARPSRRRRGSSSRPAVTCRWRCRSSRAGFDPDRRGRSRIWPIACASTVMTSIRSRSAGKASSRSSRCRTRR